VNDSNNNPIYFPDSASTMHDMSTVCGATTGACSGKSAVGTQFLNRLDTDSAIITPTEVLSDYTTFYKLKSTDLKRLELEVDHSNQLYSLGSWIYYEWFGMQPFIDPSGYTGTVWSETTSQGGWGDLSW